MSVRILIADDHVVFRSGIRALLEREPDLVVVGEAGSGDEVLTRLAATPVDVLLLDLSMPAPSLGPPLAEAVVQRFAPVRIIVLTMHEDLRYLHEMFRVGARGYMLKTSTIEDVVRGVRAVAKGEMYVDAALAGQALHILASPPADKGRLGLLTPREREVCQLLALGYTNVEAGKKLGISERTVESHRNSIMGKLDLKNRADLVRFALDHDLLG